MPITLPPEPRISEGTLQTSDGRFLPLEWTKVKAVVEGPLAQVEVRQSFRNESQETLEATYLFPLPHHGSVFRMEFRIADRVVKAVVKEKEDARRVYEKARSEGRAATLLEQERPNLFTLSVANIAPDAAIEVLLEYQEPVAYDFGEWRFSFPMIASERYQSGTPQDIGTTQVPDAARIRPPRPRSTHRQSPVSLEFELRTNAGQAPPSSPSHVIEVSASNNGYQVSLTPGQEVANRDFVLIWPCDSHGLIPRVWYERALDKPGTFSLAIPAPVDRSIDVKKAANKGYSCGNCGAPMSSTESVIEVPGLGHAWQCDYCGVYQKMEPAAKPKSGKDIIFLIDLSASVKRLKTAFEVVEHCLSKLSSSDEFKLIGFHHEILELSTDWLPADEPSKMRALKFLQKAKVKGGTELEAALRLSGSQLRKGRSRIAVLVTDGAVGNEGRLLRELKGWLRETRLYVMGVGESPNRYLIEKLAQFGRGAFEISPGGEPHLLERFSQRVAQARPVLSNITVELEGPQAQGVDIYPRGERELFSGQVLRLTGRFVGVGPALLKIRGTTFDGEPFLQDVSLTLPEYSQEAPGIERTWARDRIEELQDQLVYSPERLSEIRLETLGLAIKHHLMSPYTALVADDSEVSVDPQEPFRKVDAAEVSAGDEWVEFVASHSATLTPPSAPSRSVGMLKAIGKRFGLVAKETDPLGSKPTLGRSPKIEYDKPEPLAIASLSYDYVSPKTQTLSSTRRVRRQSPVLQTAPKRRVLYSPEELARTQDLVKGHLDLVFLIDETGSMGPYISEVQDRLLQLIQLLGASPLCRRLRLGLVTFRDHPPQDNTFVTRVVSLTSNLDEISEGVQRMRAAGGGDAPEAVTDGLHELLNLDWDQDATRMVVMIGDAPPHGVEPDVDGFPAGCPCGRHWYTQAEGCREMGITVHTVGCQGIANLPGAVQVFQTVARVTGGIYVPLSDSWLLIELVSGLADRELDRQRLEQIVEQVYQDEQQVLELADLEEQTRYLTEVLKSRELEVLDLNDGPGKPASFRPVQSRDVELALQAIRRRRPELILS